MKLIEHIFCPTARQETSDRGRRDIKNIKRKKPCPLSMVSRSSSGTISLHHPPPPWASTGMFSLRFLHLSNRRKNPRNYPLIFSNSWQFMNAPCAANASCDGGITWAVATRPLETEDVSGWSACYSLRHWGVKENNISRSDTGLKLEDGYKAQGRMLKPSPTCVFILLVNPM